MYALKFRSELDGPVEKELSGFATTATAWSLTGHDDAGANLDGVPVGAIVDYAGVTIPARWVACNGGAYSRTTHKALFKAIGVVYGDGDGATSFNVPSQAGVVGTLIIYTGVR